jgi:hypothetical protein
MSQRNVPLDSPALTVVLAVPGPYETIRKTLKHLQAQTARDRMELVIVTPSAQHFRLDPTAAAGFFGVRIVEVEAIGIMADAWAIGIEQATAAVVALGEDHSFPEPGWAEALIAAHRQPWGAVGALIVNGNPATMTSWAGALSNFAPWAEPGPGGVPVGGVMDALPGHNTSYKRTVLLEYGAKLGYFLEMELILHADLRSRGYQLYLEPAARTHHTNISRIAYFVLDSYYGGRVFGSLRARSQHWSALRRLLYVAGSPLIPFVRLWRLLNVIRRSGRQRQLVPRVLPVLLTGLTAQTAGEVMGYAFGSGAAVRVRGQFEINRNRYLVEQDQAALAT